MKYLKKNHKKLDFYLKSLGLVHGKWESSINLLDKTVVSGLN